MNRLKGNELSRGTMVGLDSDSAIRWCRFSPAASSISDNLVWLPPGLKQRQLSLCCLACYSCKSRADSTSWQPIMLSRIDFSPHMPSLALSCAHSAWHIVGTQWKCVKYHILPCNSTGSSVSLRVDKQYPELPEGQVLILTSILLRPAAQKTASLSTKPPKGNCAVVTSAAQSSWSPARGSHWGRRCMVTLYAQLFFFPGLQPTQSLHRLGPEPLPSVDLLSHEPEEGPRQVGLEAGGKDQGIQHSGSHSCGPRAKASCDSAGSETGPWWPHRYS